MEDLGSALSGAQSGAPKFKCFAALRKTESWSDGLGSKAAVICLCFFMSPVRLGSRNGSSSSNTVTQSIYFSWAPFTVLLGYNFQMHIGYPEKDIQKQNAVGMLFKAIEWTHALASRCLPAHCLPLCYEVLNKIRSVVLWWCFAAPWKGLVVDVLRFQWARRLLLQAEGLCAPLPLVGPLCLGISVCRETGQAGHMQFEGTQWWFIA